MSMPRNPRARRAHERRAHKREAKQRASYKAELKRQRTRAQTPDLWRKRVKGRAIQANPFRGWHTIRPVLPLAA